MSSTFPTSIGGLLEDYASIKNISAILVTRTCIAKLGSGLGWIVAATVASFNSLLYCAIENVAMIVELGIRDPTVSLADDKQHVSGA